jgi:uncharacterized protein YaeQ
MAQKAIISKVELSIADMDRDYYETHNLTVAKHPSETDERLSMPIPKRIRSTRSSRGVREAKTLTTVSDNCF